MSVDAVRGTSPPPGPGTPPDLLSEAVPAEMLEVARLGRSGAVQLAARTIVMRVVTVGGTIILARVLSPAVFGSYSIIALVSLILASVADFGIGASLVQQPDPPTRPQLATAWVLQQAVWIPFVVAVWAVTLVGARSFPANDEFLWQLRVGCLSVAFTMLRALPSAMLVRVMRFRAIAFIEVSMHFLFYGSAISLALLGAGVWSFVIALTIQTAGGAILANLVWAHWPGFHFDVRVAKQQLRFGGPFQVANVVTVGNDAVVQVFGGLTGGLAAIGYLQFSLRISQLAASIDEIVGRVTFPAFSRLQHDNSATVDALRDAVLLVGFVVAATQLWLASAAPLVVPIVFGDQWHAAIPALQFFCLASLASVPSRVLRSLVFGQGRSTRGLFVSFAGATALWVAFPILVIRLDLAGGGIAYVVAAVLVLLMYVRSVPIAAAFPWRELFQIYGAGGIAAVGSAWSSAAVGGPGGIVLSAIVFGTIYLIAIRLVGPPPVVSALSAAWAVLRRAIATTSRSSSRTVRQEARGGNR
jgi:O-antigen/teichoic acid export membrane protein